MGTQSRRSDDSPSTAGRVRRWLLMELHRWVLAGLILIASFLALVAISFLDLTPLREVASDQDTIESLFSALIGAIITGTAIVITINQLVLSQELGAAGDQHERMRDAKQFRREVEDAIGKPVSSTDPAEFLRDILEAIEQQADTLAETVETEAQSELRDAVLEYTDSLVQDAHDVRRSLEHSQFGTFAVISAALEFNYSWKIHRGRQLRHAYGDSVSDETAESLENVQESLTVFGSSREHFKTLYFQSELISLSQALVYTAISGLIVMVAFVMFVDETTVPGITMGVDNLVWLTSFGFTVGMTPFVIFSVYILRIATVTKRTLAIGPFILMEDKRQKPDQ